MVAKMDQRFHIAEQFLFDGIFTSTAKTIANLVDIRLSSPTLLPQVENLCSIFATVAVVVAKIVTAESLRPVELADVIQQGAK